MGSGHGQASSVAPVREPRMESARQHPVGAVGQVRRVHPDRGVAAQQDGCLRADRGDADGLGQGVAEEGGGERDHPAVRRRRDDRAEGEHRPALAVLGGDAVDPRAVGAPEVAERPGRRVEGVAQEPDVLPGPLRDLGPAERPAVEQVDLEGAGDVVGAGAVRRVRRRERGVLRDPERAGQRIEVLAADREERHESGDRRRAAPPARTRPQALMVASCPDRETTEAGATTRSKRRRYSAPTSDQIMFRL